MRPFFLIGMPGAGKTFWGGRVASAFHMQFIDLDLFIENDQQKTITELFKQHGENGFREIEHNTLKMLTSGTHQNTIIACGGGTPCFLNNMDLMNQSGITIYLGAAPARLVQNLLGATDCRPLLKSKADLAGYLETLLGERKVFYEQAQYILQTENISLTTFGEIISSCTNRQ